MKLLHLYNTQMDAIVSSVFVTSDVGLVSFSTEGNYFFVDKLTMLYLHELHGHRQLTAHGTSEQFCALFT
jgi:hypothetical protein